MTTGTGFEQRTQNGRDGMRARVRAWGDRRAARAVEGLYESVRADPDAATGRDAASVAASALAVCVHLVTLGLVVLAVVLLVVTPLRALGVVAALLLLGAAWLTRPRPGTAPEDVRWVQAPLTLRLVRDVAQASGAPVPHRVGFDHHLNATYAVVGWRRERLLVIGMPLWEALPPQQRVALLGHELGHAAAKDSRHLLLVSTALEALHEWMLVCRYETPGVTGAGRATLYRETGALVQVGEVVTRWLLTLLGLVPAAAYGLLLVATQRQSQRAEYGADIAGARVAGRPAMVATLSTLMEQDALVLAMRRTAMGSTSRDVLGAVRDEGLRLAGSGWPDRRNRHRSGPFDSHPPDDLRRALVQTLAERPPAYVLDRATCDAVDAELDEVRAWANRRAYDGFQAH